MAIYLQFQCTSSVFDVNAVILETAEDKNDVREISRERADVFPEKRPDGLPPERSHFFCIKLTENAQPRRSGIYRLSGWELGELKAQLSILIRKRSIRLSASPWGSSVLFADENDGGRRMCIDNRALTKATIKIECPLPRTDNIFDQLRKASTSRRSTSDQVATRFGLFLILSR